MKIRLVVNTNANNLIRLLDTQGGPNAWYLRKISSLFQSFSLGAWNSNTILVNNTVTATGTITFSSVVATDTVTIAGTVFTGSDTPSTSVQFLTGSTDTASAASLAAKINAHTTVGKYVSATSSGAVVTISCIVPGLIGNLITLAISAHGSRSGATLAGGTEGNTNTFAHGL